MFKKSLFKKIKQLKSKYLIFHTIIFVSIILFSSLIDGINKSIIIEKYYFDNMKIISLINLNLKINGLRNITAEKTWYDSFFLKFYKRLYLYETPVISKGRIDIANIICKKTYYCTVNIDENLNRLNNNEIIELYNDYFIKNITDKVSFKEAERLGINERLLINNETGEPVVFYRYYSYKTTDGFNKELKNFKLKIQSDEKEKKAIVLGFAGDTAIEDFVKDAIKQYGTDFAFNEVKNIIDFPDIMSVNLECCVTERGEREEKHFTFRSSEDDFKIIASSSIDYVSTANNHIKDYGESGIIDTKEFLNKNNISHSGCGKNIDEAFKPVCIKIKDVTFSYFSICEVADETGGYETMKMFKAGENSSGVAYYDIEKLKELFKIEKDKNSIIIVQYHTGIEYTEKPSGIVQKHAKELIDIGADSVICHHPHVIQGTELYKDRIIAYSLGDFLFDIQKPNADEGIIIYLYVFNNRISTWSFYPTVSHFGSVVLNEERINEVEKRFIKLTSKLLERN